MSPPGASERDCTERPEAPASSPKTDQPPAPIPAPATASSKPTSIRLRETAVALTMDGACPSASAWSRGPTEAPRGSSRNRPVADGGALAGVNETTCSPVPPPSYPPGATVLSIPSMRSAP